MDTCLALTRDCAVRATQDRHWNSGEFYPRCRVMDRGQSDSELIPVTRANGHCVFRAGAGRRPGVRAIWIGRDQRVGRVNSGPSRSRLGWHSPSWPRMDLDASVRELRRQTRRGRNAKSLKSMATDRRAKLRLDAGLFRRGQSLRQRKMSSAKARFSAGKIPAGKQCCLTSEGELPVMLHADELVKLKQRWTGPKRTITR